MNDQQPNRVPIGVVAGVAALLVALGGGMTWWTLNSRSLREGSVVPTPTASPSPITSPTPAPTSPSQVERTLDIYFVQDNNGQLEWVAQPVTVTAANDPTAFLTAAFEQLLAGTGTQNSSATSQIPPGTQLLSLRTQDDQVYVDLSAEFTQGGGSASMIGRLGQVIYTASTLNPNAKVWISVGGKPLEVLGGEGLEVPQPSTRESFNQEF